MIKKRSLNNQSRLRLLFILTGSLITFISLYQVSQNNFLPRWDDAQQVLQNSDIKSLNFSNISKIFSSYYVGMYQPVTTITYAIDYAIAGLSPFWFHLSNLFYHLFVVIIVFFFINKIIKNDFHSILITLIFSLHPVNIESIAWISARSTMLFTAFFLLSSIFYLKHLSKKHIKDYGFSLFFFFIACLSKSAAITLPVLLIVFDYFYDKINIKTLLFKLPFFAGSILFGLLTINARAEAHQLTDLSDYFSNTDLFFIVTYSIFRYLSIFIAPHNYSAFYTYPEKIHQVLPIQYYIVSIILIALFVFFIIKTFRKKKPVLMGIMFFLVTISIMLKLIPAGLQVIADRYLYLPVIGLLISLYFAIKPLIKKYKYLIIGVFILFFSFLIYQSNQYINYWANEETLYNQTLKHDQDAVPIKNFLGIILKNKGQYKKALKMFDEIIEKHPEYGSAYNNRANLYKDMGKFNKALDDYNIALLYEGNSEEIFTNMGVLYAIKKEYRIAVNYFNKAIALNDSYYLAYFNRAKTFAEKGVYNKAIKDLNQTIKINPDFAMAYFTRGMVYYSEKNFDKACTDIRKASSLGLDIALKYQSQICK